MKQIDGMDRYTVAFAGIPYEPLLVRAHLRPGSPVVAYDPVYLDNLLARCVVDHVTNGAGLPPSDEPYWLPIPVRMLWQSLESLPLWAASVFHPLGVTARDMVYTHKRAPQAVYCEPRGIKNNTGRWMDRRLPIPTAVCTVWEARCYGNKAAILRLLENISFLGKRRAIGMGEIADWEVTPADFSPEETVIRDGVLTHALPQEYLMYRQQFVEGHPYPVGWSPPQWKVSMHSPGYAVGGRISD